MSTVAPADPPSAADAWELVPLGRAGWRICDASRGAADAARLVAYVERSETGALDVLWLRSPCPTRSRYGDLDEIIAELNAAVAAAATPVDRSARPIGIPHFPPAR